MIRHRLRDSATNTIIQQWVENATLPLTVVAEGEDTVRPIDDASLRSAVEAAIPRGPFGLQIVARKGMIDVSVRFVDLPVPVAFDVFARRGDREWRLGGLSCTGEVDLSTGFLRKPKDLAGFDPDVVDVIFRSSPQVARESMNIVEFWSGEIIIEDVPVERN